MPELEPQTEEEQQQEQDLLKSLRGVPVGYTPLPSNVPGEPEGSLWKANLLDNNTIASFVNSTSAQALAPEDNVSIQDIVNNIPEDKVMHADKYVGIKMEDFPLITAEIDKEDERKALIAAHPIQSFFINAAESPLDPINYLPFGAIYKNAQRSSNLMKSIVGSGMAAATGAATQEAILQQNQLTRTAEESAMNIVATGLIGSAFGGLGHGLTAKGTLKSAEQINARQRIKSEVMDVITDKDKELDPDQLLKSEDLANFDGKLRGLMLSTSMNRLLKSPFGLSKWFSNEMYDKGYTLNKHLQGEASDISIERRTRADYKRMEASLVQYDKIFYESVGIQEGVFQGTRAKLAKMTGDVKTEFDRNVWQVLSTETPHENSHVNRAAEHYRKSIIDPLSTRLIDAGVLPEGVTPKNAPGYVMSVYLKDKIIETGGRSARYEGSFPDTLHKGFKAIRDEIKVFRESPLFKDLESRTAKAEQELKQLREQKKTTPKEQKPRIKKLNEAIKEKQDSLKTLDEEFKETTPRRLLNSKGKLRAVLDDEQLWTEVDQTVDNILGDNAGMLLNPILERLKGGATKPLKERKMSIEQVDLKDWQLTDMGKLAEMYTRALSPVVHMTEFAQRHGHQTVEEFTKDFEQKLMNEFKEKSKGLTGKQAQKMRATFDRDISDIKATMQLIEGVYGDGPNVLNNSAKNFYNNFLKWNASRLLGFMTMSSFPDAGRQVMVHGPYRVIHDGLIGSFSDVRKVAKRDLQAIGYASETLLGSRIKSYADTQGLSTAPGPFTRGLDVATKGIGNLSLMNQWNNVMHEMAGHIGINRTLQTVRDVVEGKAVSEKEILRLNRLGLARENFEIIHGYTKNNVDESGTMFADWTNWEVNTKAQRNALEQFQAVVGKEIEEIVIVPGLGDKPLVGHRMAGKILFQFKTFLMAATNKILVTGIQNKNDINTYMGVISMLSLGALSYVATSAAKGRPIDLSFINLAKESVDRSGLLGIYGEFANIGYKASGLGTTSRYQSRNIVGSFLGPSYGAAGEVIEMYQAIARSIGSDEKITTKDIDKFKRLFPLQNAAPIDRISTQIFRRAGTSLGATDVSE